MKGDIKKDRKSDRAEAKVIRMIEKDEGTIANLFEGQSGHKNAASVHASNLPSVYPSSHPSTHPACHPSVPPPFKVPFLPPVGSGAVA